MLHFKPGLPTLLPLLPLLLCVTAACSTLEDNGTRLAFALERESKVLLASGNNELQFEFKPKGSANQDYEIKMLRGKDSREQPFYGGYITVSGVDSGGTSYQGRYVNIPKSLHVAKRGEPAVITLRKVAGRVDVVELK